MQFFSRFFFPPLLTGKFINPNRISQTRHYWHCSVAKSSPTLCDPRECSTQVSCRSPHLLGFAQAHVHSISDTIQLFHPLPPSSPIDIGLDNSFLLWKVSGHCRMFRSILALPLDTSTITSCTTASQLWSPKLMSLVTVNISWAQQPLVENDWSMMTPCPHAIHGTQNDKSTSWTLKDTHRKNSSNKTE